MALYFGTPYADLVSRCRVGDERAQEELREYLFRYYCIPRETRRGEHISRSAWICEQRAWSSYSPRYHDIVNEAELLGTDGFETAFPGYMKDLQANRITDDDQIVFERYLRKAVHWRIIDFIRRPSQEYVEPIAIDPELLAMEREELQRLFRLLERFPQWLAILGLDGQQGLIEVLRREMDNDTEILLQFLYSSSRYTELVNKLSERRNIKRGTLYTQISRLRSAWHTFYTLDKFQDVFKQSHLDFQNFRNIYLSSDTALQSVFDAVTQSFEQFSNYDLDQHVNNAIVSLRIKQKDIFFNAFKKIREKWDDFLRRR